MIVDAKILKLRDISAEAYDHALSSTVYKNLNKRQCTAGAYTNPNNLPPQLFQGLNGVVDTPEPTFLQSQLAPEACRLSGYNPLEQLIAYQRYHTGGTNTIQIVQQCTVNVLEWVPSTVGSNPTDFPTVNGMQIVLPDNTTTTWSFNGPEYVSFL